MTKNRLEVGIDFSRKMADSCYMSSDGEVLVRHCPHANSRLGSQELIDKVCQLVEAHGFDGVDISGEATSYYWFPFFLDLFQNPTLNALDVNLHLLNPRWVYWYIRSFPTDNKSDRNAPFYIADRLRNHPPSAAWSPQMETLPIRFFTRARFHIVKEIVRAKCYYSTLLFLKASSYQKTNPFSNLYGVTSRLVLEQYPTLDELASIPAEQLCRQLMELSNHRLPDPLQNANKLKQAAIESFCLPDSLIQPIHRILSLTLNRIDFLQTQIKQLETWIAEESKLSPSISILATIPGVGPVYSSAIVAEIGGVERFLQGKKWDKKRRRYRSKNLRDAEDAIAKMAGLWWPENSSGDFEGEDRRMAKTGNRYLRYYLIEAANQLRSKIPTYSEFYARKYREANKHNNKRALVLTARKSLGLYVGLLHRQEAYHAQEVSRV